VPAPPVLDFTPGPEGALDFTCALPRQTVSDGRIYRRDTPADLRGMPKPRWDLLDMKNYVFYRPFVIQQSRGCPYTCDFCAERRLNGDFGFRDRPAMGSGRFNGGFHRGFGFGFSWSSGDSWDFCHKLEIKLVLAGLAGISIASRHHQSQMPSRIGRRATGKVQNGLFNPAFEASAPQHGKGNFAVNSETYWRTPVTMSNPIFQNLCFIRAGSPA